MTSWFRGFIQGKTRITLAWIFAGILVFSAKKYPSQPGIVLCMLGASLRFWASGFLRKDSRPAVGGPYAYVRNPLYLGTYLMALGTAMAIGSFWLSATISVLYAWIYHFIILDEETKLERIFGDCYRVYKNVVPRFFPRLWPPLQPADFGVLSEVNPEPSHHEYSWELASKNKAYEAYLSFLGLIGFVTLIAFCWQRWGHILR